MPDALPAVTVPPSGLKAARSGFSFSAVVPGPRVLVGVELEGLALLRARNLDRHDLRLELAALDGSDRPLLALGRELVLLLARELVLGGDVLRRDSHVHVGDRTRETVGDHRVEQLLVPHPDAEARLLRDVRRAAHALHPARDHDVGVAQHDRLRSQDGRLEPRPARLVHREGRLLLRQPALHGRHPRRIQPETGREHVPEDDLVDLLVLELRAPDGFADCDGAELGGGLLGECAAERADGGAGRAHDDCLGHDGILLAGNEAERGARDRTGGRI